MRHVWLAKLKQGKSEEYAKRHAEIWPEVREVLVESGIRNYSIWIRGTEVIGYFEYDSEDHLHMRQSADDWIHRWKDYMGNLFLEDSEADPEKFSEIFYLL
ncbi:MAG: L-rhamnose mutarotase [Sphaerochaeta sp.]|jgi:L-rhamnose mutarotase|uniref:L-rhamnose mutarotase n=1 Tax=Sphaerochaeta sp. TaxID=1972642 RepID=UPI003D0E3108